MSQRLLQDLIQKVLSFLLHMRRLWLQHHHFLTAIGNMDETPLWLDMPGDTIISKVGDQQYQSGLLGTTKANSQCFWLQWLTGTS